MPVAIREARDEDLDAVMELWRELQDYHHELDPLAWTVAPDGSEKARAWFHEALGSGDRLLLVAEQAGEIVGFVHGVLGDGPPPLVPRRAVNVTDVAVRSTHRRQGIGRSLMEAIADRMAERGAVEVKLSVAAGNTAALALYEAMGFELVMYSMRRIMPCCEPTGAFWRSRRNRTVRA